MKSTPKLSVELDNRFTYIPNISREIFVINEMKVI